MIALCTSDEKRISWQKDSTALNIKKYWTTPKTKIRLLKNHYVNDSNNLSENSNNQ